MSTDLPVSTDLDVSSPAQRAIYRYGGRGHGEAPAAVVDNNSATRPIHTSHTGQHDLVVLQDPDDAEPLPRWRHARRRWDPTDPAWIVAAAIVAAIVALVVAVAW